MTPQTYQQVAAMVADELHTKAGQALISVNAAVNDVCANCLAAETYGILHLAAMLHHRPNFASDEEFVQSMVDAIGQALEFKLAQPGTKAWLAEHTEHLSAEDVEVPPDVTIQ